MRLAGARDVIELIDEERARLQRGVHAALTGLLGEAADALELADTATSQPISSLPVTSRPIVVI